MQRKLRVSPWLLLILLQVFSVASSQAAINVASYWRLGENDPGAASGVTATNIINLVGGKNLKAQGNARYTNDVAATAASRTGSSLSLNFTNSAYATNTIVSTATDNFGIECWAKPTALGGGQVIVYNGGTGGIGDGGWGIILAADNTYEGLFGGVTAFGTNVATQNVWTHLALVRVGGVSTLYINGAAVYTTNSTPIVPSGNFALAAPPQSPTSQFFTGLLDEVRVFTFAAGQFSTNDLLWNENPTAYAVGTTNLLEGPAAGSDSVVLSATPAGTPWTNTTNAGWLHLTAPNQTGTGSSNIIFSFDANSGATRSGTLTVAGQTVTVTQAGSTYAQAGTLTTLAPALNQPGNLAVDSAGNVYIANTGSSTILKWTRAGNAVSTVVPVSAGLDFPQSVAVDNLGNLFITDTGNQAVKKWNLGAGTMSTILSSGIGNPWAIATDRSGNAYFVGDLQGALYKWVAAGNNVVTLSPGVVSSPEGVAVDAAGNVYVPDTSGLPFMHEYIATNGQWVYVNTAGVSSPQGLGVDGSGNLYTATFTTNSVVKWSAATGIQTTLTTSSVINRPEGAAVDSAGNVYIADTSGNRVVELPYAFVDSSAKSETAAAGSDVLPAVLPASVNLQAPFAPTSDQGWLTINGSTNGVVGFSFTINTGAPRAAHVSLLGQTITVTQGSATISLGVTNLVEAPVAGVDSAILLVSPGNYAWSAAANAGWLHLAPGFQNGTGSTNVVFSFDTNSGPTRTGTLTIANQTLTVTQAGATYLGYNDPGQYGIPPVNIFKVNDFSVGPGGVAVDNAGNVYFSDVVSSMVFEWIKTNNTVVPFISNGLASPTGLAFDNAGNLYISDTGNNALKQWSIAKSNVTTLVGSGLNSPVGVAVDGSGNVFIADSGNNAIKEWTAAGSNVVTLVSTGLNQPAGVAVDLLGNVYIGDTLNAVLKKYTPASGNVVTVTNTPDGHFAPSQLAVDGSGNVYIADNGHGAIAEWSPASQSLNNLVYNGLGYPVAVAVDGSGNVYLADGGADSVAESPRAFVDSTSKNEPYTAGSNMLPVVVPANANLLPPFLPTNNEPWLVVTGATNGVTSFSFAENDTGIDRKAFISSFNQTIIVDQGAIALGVSNLWEGPAAGTDSVVLASVLVQSPWTASPNASWLHLAPPNQSGSGSTNVVFTYDANSGPTRSGTLTLGGQALTVTQAGSTYVAAPVPVTVLVSNGPVNPSGVAVDNAGNVYIADAGNNRFTEWLTASNSVITLATGFNHPNGVTVDNFGDVLVTDSSTNGFYAIVSGSTFPLVTSGLSNPFSSVFNPFVGFYVCDTGDNAVKSWDGGNGSLAPVVTTGLNHPKGLAIDLAENLYIADTGNNTVKEWLAASSNVVTVIAGGLAGPSGVAVDGSGNLYIADTGNNAIKKWSAVTHAVSTLISNGLSGPTGVAVDNFGNVYIADSGNNKIKELPRAFVDPTPRLENLAAGTDALPAVLPPVNLLPPFTPTSDQPWLAITGTAQDVVSFSFTNDPGAARTGNISVLGEPVAVIQTNLIVAPPLLTGATLLGNGTFRFTFTNSQTTNFTVISTTDLTLPLANWTVLGSPSNTSPGVFQFTTTATNDSRRFYGVRTP